MTAVLFLRVALGLMLASAGAASLALAALYRGASALTLVSFGLFSGCYGTLVLLQVPPIGALLGLSPRELGFVITAISYPVPGFGMLYAEQIRGRGWLSLLRRFWQVGLPLAAVFVIYDLSVGRPGASFGAYQVYLVASLLVLLPHVVLFQHRDRIERVARMVGTGLLAVTLLIDILSRLLSWPVTLDSFGIAAFVLAQGVVTARRFFADQRELAAVEHELETARTIQTSILPQAIPRVKGVSIAVRYLPAQRVAGDLYDFMLVDDRHVGVLVADVAGHGVSAALIASMTTVAFASQRPHASDTARTLAEMNRVLCGHFDSRYITAAYLFVDAASRRVRYSLAGHPPPLLLHRETGAIEKLGEGSLVLGLLPDAAYSSTELTVASSDRLIIYTDGLAEVQNRNDEWFGDAELARMIRQHADKDAESFCTAVIGHLVAWAGPDIDDGRSPAGAPRFRDDLTLVVIDF